MCEWIGRWMSGWVRRWVMGGWRLGYINWPGWHTTFHHYMFLIVFTWYLARFFFFGLESISTVHTSAVLLLMPFFPNSISGLQQSYSNRNCRHALWDIDRIPKLVEL